MPSDPLTRCLTVSDWLGPINYGYNAEVPHRGMSATYRRVLFCGESYHAAHVAIAPIHPD
jgi:hypothetical protein